MTTCAARSGSLHVIKPGLWTTVQDLGRPHLRHQGVPVGGAMDAPALELGNRLVGNSPHSAGLELTMQGDTLSCAGDMLIAMTGAQFLMTAKSAEGITADVPFNRPVLLRAGTELACGVVSRGCRGYLSIAGGIAVPQVLGSRSALTRSGFSELAGRTLRRGDEISVGLWSDESQVIAQRLRDCLRPTEPLVAPNWFVRPEPLPLKTATLQVIRGPQFDWLADSDRDRLFSAAFRIGPQSDRMGYRLTAAQPLMIHQQPLLSAGTCAGMIQVPPDGQPILLMADCAPTGGYPCVASVIRSDLSVAAQLRPGNEIMFSETTIPAAHDRLRQQRTSLDQAIQMARLKLRS